MFLVCELQGLGIEPTTFRTGGELLFWDRHKPSVDPPVVII